MHFVGKYEKSLQMSFQTLTLYSGDNQKSLSQHEISFCIYFLTYFGVIDDIQDLIPATVNS